MLSLAVSARAPLLAFVVLAMAVGGSHSKALVSEQQPTPILAELTSENQRFRVKLELETEDRVPIGRYHNWLLTLSDAQLVGVHPATISISGGMPSHGHGLPTAPRVASHLGQGVYRIEGLKFHMPGQWVVRFHITTEHMQDYVEVTLNIAP